MKIHDNNFREMTIFRELFYYFERGREVVGSMGFFVVSFLFGGKNLKGVNTENGEIPRKVNTEILKI